MFYNLPIAGAALLVVSRVVADRAPSRAIGAAAMALLGLAFEIKTTVLFEGTLLAAFLLHAGWRAGRRRAALAGDALAYGLSAAWPTALVMLFYAWRGALGAWLFANTSSILLRAPLPGATQRRFLAEVVVSLVPLLPPMAAALRRPTPRMASEWAVRRFVLGRLAAGTLAFGAIGNFYSHYALQLIAPLLLVGATAVRRGSFWLPWMVALLPIRLIGFGDMVARDVHEHWAQVEGLVAAARPYARECMHIFEGPPSVYLLTGACTVTPYLFPEHLVIARETRALGIDQRSEVVRILHRRPGTIITAPRTFQTPNYAVARLIRSALARDYREIYVAPAMGWSGAILQPHLFVRRDLLPRQR